MPDEVRPALAHPRSSAPVVERVRAAVAQLSSEGLEPLRVSLSTADKAKLAYEAGAMDEVRTVLGLEIVSEDTAISSVTAARPGVAARVTVLI